MLGPRFRWTAAAAIVVLLLTVAVLAWATSTALDGCAMARPGYTTESTLWAIWCSSASLTVAAMSSAFLLYGAWTPYLRRVACYAALIWGQQVVPSIRNSLACSGSELAVLFEWLNMPVSLAVIVSSSALASARVAALEASALQPMGARTLTWLLRVGGIVGFAYIVLFALAFQPMVVECVAWLGLLMGAAFLVRLTLALRSAERSTVNFTRGAAGRRREEAKLAAKILRQQTYGVWLCLGSTWIYLFCIFLTYHGLWPIPQRSVIWCRSATTTVAAMKAVFEDALHIKNRPTHGEVMMTDTGPCLVEMNCRAHGGDGSWTPLAGALTGGYAQVTATIDAFVGIEKFNQLPDTPPAPFKAAGQEVVIGSFTKGKVVGTPGFDKIKALPSFVFLESGSTVGSEIEYTTDLFTNVGSVILMHQSQAVLEKDVDTIRQMEQDCAISELETAPVVLSRPRSESETKKTLEEMVAEDSWFNNSCTVM